MRFAARLLGAHVRRRAHDAAIGRHGHLAGFAFGEAEVHQVGLARGVDQDVGRLEVAMNDAMRVSVLQSIRDVRHDFRRPASIESAGFEAFFKRLPFDEFRHKVANRLIGLPDFVKRDDARMFQLGNAAGFSLEAICLLDVRQSAGALDFDGHGAIERRVIRAEDITEGASAEFGLELKFAESTIAGRQPARVHAPSIDGDFRRQTLRTIACDLSRDFQELRRWWEAFGALDLQVTQTGEQSVRVGIECLQQRFTFATILYMSGDVIERCRRHIPRRESA